MNTNQIKNQDEIVEEQADKESDVSSQKFNNKKYQEYLDSDMEAFPQKDLIKTISREKQEELLIALNNSQQNLVFPLRFGES